MELDCKEWNLRSGTRMKSGDQEWSEWNLEWNLECICFPMLPLTPLHLRLGSRHRVAVNQLHRLQGASLRGQTEASLSQSHCQWSVKFWLPNSVQEIRRKIKDPSTAVLFPSLLHLLQSQLEPIAYLDKLITQVIPSLVIWTGVDNRLMMHIWRQPFTRRSKHWKKIGRQGSLLLAATSSRCYSNAILNHV